MSKVDFNQPVNRHNTSSVKWERYTDQSVLPMWIADTDFKAPDAILKALTQRIEHGVFGYTNASDELNQTIVERMQRLYDWQINSEWIVWIPGLVCGLNISCRALSALSPEIDSNVLIPDPIYPYFNSAAKYSNVAVNKIPMSLQGERWVVDFEALEASITPETIALLFCNPHNPAGTVYTVDELQKISDILLRHNLYICSDEIHCDLLLDKNVVHTPLASLNTEIGQQCITLMAPSKSFNIAGLGCSFAIIANKDLRHKFQGAAAGIVPSVNLLGYSATLAAYTQCDTWLEQKTAYISANHDYLMQEINAIPGLKMLPHQATFLAWIDVSAAKLDNPAAFFEQAGVGLSPGSEFGDNNYVRMNFGCTKELLVEAVTRMRNAITKQLQGL
ncbi:MAG: putative C-S lyase [Oceanospirillaceae bacterium]|nr:putative C-S lyase [Oceanospirillaceae bacterium]